MRYKKIIKNYELTPVEKSINEYLHCKDIDDNYVYYINNFDKVNWKDVEKHLSRILKCKNVKRNIEICRLRYFDNMSKPKIANKYSLAYKSVTDILERCTKAFVHFAVSEIKKDEEEVVDEHGCSVCILNVNLDIDKYSITNKAAIELPTIAYNAMVRGNGINNKFIIEDYLEGKKYSELLRLKGIGKSSLSCIINFCKKYNINLVPDIVLK